MDLVGETPRHAYLDPRLYNLSSPQLAHPSNVKTDQDRQFIDNWLAEKGKFQLTPAYYCVKKPRNDLNISSAKQSLRNCLAIMAKLNKTQDELRNNVETMSSHEWKQKTLEIGSLKDEFNKYMSPFEDGKILSGVKGALKMRAKKRTNQRNRRKLRQELIKTKKEKQTEIHKNIDSWLENKKEEAERVKMEEKMKKDADCVLYEVTKKKSEARKQLSLISALVKLRTVRDNMAVQRGEKPSVEDRQAFGLVTEKLVRMWENAFQNYCKEEQCLKVMLDHNASKDTKAAVQAKQSRVVEEWENLIFGAKDSAVLNNPTFWALTSAERDLETFVAIRKSWDTFVNSNGTSIPIGWVVPSLEQSKAWASYLKTD